MVRTSAVPVSRNLIKNKRFLKINLQLILLGNCDLDDHSVWYEGCYRQWKVVSSWYGWHTITVSQDSV